MLNFELARQLELTEEEMEFFARFRDPEEFQAHLTSFDYKYEDGYESCPSVRRAMKEDRLHCLSGAVLSAAYIFLHDRGPPLLVCMEDPYEDHNIAVFWEDGHVGALGFSKIPELRDRAARFRSYRDLVMSFHPVYNLDGTNGGVSTLRGFSAPIDLRMFEGWATAEEDIRGLLDYLYGCPYEALFPDRPELYRGLPPAGDGWYYSPRQTL